jgi:hypothetical protein
MEPHSDDAGLVAVDVFAAGGRVEQTGIALVHEGEWILPAPGSAADVTPVSAEALGAGVVNYYFPVEVEMIGDLTDAQRRAVADQIYDELDAALRGGG